MEAVTSCVTRFFHEPLLYSSNTPVFHPPEISALMLGSKHLCSSPEVPDSVTVPTTGQLHHLSRLVDALEKMMSLFPHVHTGTPRSSTGCSCSCRVLHCGHGWVRAHPQIQCVMHRAASSSHSSSVPADPTGRDEPHGKFQELTN